MHKQLEQRNPCYGTWLSLGSPVVAELGAECGLGWMLLDLEHGYATEEAVIPALQAIRGSDTSLIIRVGSLDPVLIGRVLDWGADGIMAPRIDKADDAAAYVEAMYYPPEGCRGYSSSARAFSYGIRSKDAGPKRPLLLAQIESWQAVCNATAIGSVEGVDALFVGPSDLKMNLAQNTEGGSYELALEGVHASSEATGVSAGILVSTVRDAAEMVDRGFTCIAVGSDVGILRQAYRSLASPPVPQGTIGRASGTSNPRESND